MSTSRVRSSYTSSTSGYSPSVVEKQTFGVLSFRTGDKHDHDHRQPQRHARFVLYEPPDHHRILFLSATCVARVWARPLTLISSSMRTRPTSASLVAGSANLSRYSKVRASPSPSTSST